MKEYDVAIIGAGPAGLTAAIFSARRGLKTLVLGDPGSMSQAEEATVIDNWPGETSIAGAELVKRLVKHAEHAGAELVREKVVAIEKHGKKAKEGGKGFTVMTGRSGKPRYISKTIIMATGTKHRKGIVNGETKYSGRGVSYCAACDAPMFKGKRVLYIGGGDSAVMGALLSERVGSETMLIHRRDRLRAVESQQEQILKSKVRIFWNTVPVEIKGDKFVRSIEVMNTKTNKKQDIPVDAVFVTLGKVPTAELAKKLGIKTNEKGFIVVDKDMKTNVPGVFAAGDCTDNPLKQVISACGDGAVAATSSYFYFHDY